MTQHPHYSMEAIALWVVHPQSDEVEPGLETHLSECAACGAAADSLRRLAEAAGPALTPVPDGLDDRIRALLDPVASEETTFLVAQLIEDTRELSGVRGASDGGRFVLFEASGYELVIQMVQRAGDSVEVRGQLHGPPSASVDHVRVCAVHKTRILGECETGESGEIRMNVPALPYHVELTRGPLRIRTPEIH